MTRVLSYQFLEPLIIMQKLVPWAYVSIELWLPSFTDPGALRQSLDYRHEGRRCLLRFRRDPLAYLSSLEQSLLTPCLPP